LRLLSIGEHGEVPDDSRLPISAQDHRFTRASAQTAARRGKIADWVSEFLASRGSDNAILAAALAQDPHSWAGPLEVALGDLEPLAGPADEEVLCPIDPTEWENEVEAIEARIDEGWDPPPLLVEYQNGQLLLQDGNHRYEALVRKGQPTAWVIVYGPEALALEQLIGTSTNEHS
jgi:hypothetical protein